MAVERFMDAVAFEDWIEQAENADRTFELINGEIVEKVSSQKPSRIAGQVYFLLKLYLTQNPIGRVTPTDGSYRVGKNRLVPDVGYISKARQPAPSQDSHNPLPPDLAVEVLSPRDDEHPGAVKAKIGIYLAAGTVVWVIAPRDETITVPHPAAARPRSKP